MTATGVCSKCQKPLPEGLGRVLCSACLIEAALVDPRIHQALLESSERHRSPGIGRRVGDYELLEEIARGGMGVIYRARQLSLGRVVALKMILSGQFASEAELSRFRIEAEAIAKLDHPNIVPIYHVGEDDGRPYFAMKLIEGKTIAPGGHFKNDGSASRTIALRDSHATIAALVAKIARAIHFAHQHGILHRDLKPANILVDAEGEPHVTDFGLAKQLGSSVELTASGAILGTPSYMAPEQATGHGSEITTAVDVWSLGAVLYELLTGQAPFHAATPLATMRAVLEEEPIPPSQLIRRLNPKSQIEKDLETICLKCLQKKTALRYRSAEDLAEDLEHWLHREPIHARPASPWEIAWKWARRKPALATLLVVAAIAPATIIGVLLLTGARVTRERNHVQEQERITRQNLYAADINVAWRALEDYDYNLAWTALGACRPASAKPSAQSESDLRGFEWRWLMQRAQGEGRKAVARHLAPINSIAWSADGRFVASASDDGTARLWDAAQEKMVRSFEEPGNVKPLQNYTDQRFNVAMPFVMWSATFSADSRTLLTASGRAITTWEAETGRRLWSRPTNTYSIAVFSPTDPNLALVWRSFPRTALGVLDLAHDKITSVLATGRADTVCFTPNGKMFARRDRGLRTITLQKFPSGEVLASVITTNIPEFYVEQMVISPDGRTLAACDLYHGPIQLFDLPSLHYSGSLTGHTGRGSTLAVSPDGRWLASGNFDQTIRLWDLTNRHEIRQFHGHQSAALALAFSPDSRRLVSGGRDGTVRFWDLDLPSSPNGITNVIGPFVFSPDGHWLVTEHLNGIARLWELPGRRIACEWQTPPFQHAVFTTNHNLVTATIGSGDAPPYVRMFPIPPFPASSDFRAAATTALLRGVPDSCTAVAISVDAHFFATGYRDGTVALWNQSGRLLHHADRTLFADVKLSLPNQVDGVAFSLNGQTLVATRQAPLGIKTWDVRGWQETSSQNFGQAHPLPLAISPDGGQLAFGGMTLGLAVNLWNVPLQKPGTSLRGHEDFLYAVAYAPDGRTLATGGRDGMLKLWHLASGRELGTILALTEDVQFAAIGFSPDGTWLGATDTHHRLHLFHAPTMTELNAIGTEIFTRPL